MFVMFLLNVLLSTRKQKKYFEDISVRRSLFLSACRRRVVRISFPQMGQEFKIGGVFGYEDSYLDFLFVIPKC